MKRFSRQFLVYVLATSYWLLTAAPPAAAYTTNMNASVVTGQENFTNKECFITKMAKLNDKFPLNSPSAEDAIR